MERVPVISVVTRTVVDKDDQAFENLLNQLVHSTMKRIGRNESSIPRLGIC